MHRKRPGRLPPGAIAAVPAAQTTEMDQAQTDSQRRYYQGQPFPVRFVILGVVALLSVSLQLTAVWPNEHHWATVSDSIAELEFHGQIPLDKIPDEDYALYRLKYDLWNAKEKFCTEGDAYWTYAGSYDTPRDDCYSVTTAIEGQDGGESCRGDRGDQCEDHFAATNTARATTCVALICAAVVALGFLFVYIRARRLGRKLEALPKTIFGAAVTLAVGGLVGLAGAYNYRSTVAAAVRKGQIDGRGDGVAICDRGCELSLYGGLVAMVVGITFAAFEAYFNGKELRGIDVKEPDFEEKIYWLEETAMLHEIGDVRNLRFDDWDDCLKKAMANVGPGMGAVAVQHGNGGVLYIKQNVPEMSRDASMTSSVVCTTFWREPAMKDKTREAKSADPAPVATRSPAKPTTEPEAEAEAADERPRPGFTRKLSSFLFGEQEPVAESEGVVVEVEPPAMREQEELEPEC